MDKTCNSVKIPRSSCGCLGNTQFCEDEDDSNPKVRLTVKNESGKKMIVTTVKTRIALLFDSAIIASSFCSIVRSWKS